VKPLSIEEGFEQGSLVLAVAVTVLENFGGGMWLESSDAKGKADVADIARDPVVESFCLFLRFGPALHDLIGFGANLGSHRSTIVFQ